MIRAERHERILAELARRGTVSAQELAGLLGASPATIRRDIAELDRRRAVTRSHGGASLPRRQEEPPFDAKLTARLPEKRRIAAEAAARLEAGTVVGFGGGTTVMQMVPALMRRRLRVVTTAVNVALALREAAEVEVTLTGGVLRRRTAEMVGHVAERTLRDVHLDVAVIGVDGLDAAAGLTTYDASEAYVNRVMIERAREVWVVADHSKVGVVRPAVICPLGSASRLYTDAGLAPDAAGRLREAGLEVISV